MGHALRQTAKRNTSTHKRQKYMQGGLARGRHDISKKGHVGKRERARANPARGGNEAKREGKGRKKKTRGHKRRMIPCWMIEPERQHT